LEESIDSKVKAKCSDLEIKVTKLESDLDHAHETEVKMRSLVNQSRTQVNKLTTELEISQEELKKREHVSGGCFVCVLIIWFYLLKINI